jgi:hypothetical protein
MMQLVTNLPWLKRIICRQIMARSLVADGGDALETWRVPVNVFLKTEAESLQMSLYLRCLVGAPKS